MLVIVGSIVVMGAVLAGFTMAGGHIGALLHPSEFVTIGGAALGGLIVMCPKKVLIDLIKGVLQLLKGSKFNKALYFDTLKVIYAMARVARKDGVLALDAHISSPGESAIFQRYTAVSGNHHVRDFICGALGMLSDGSASPEQLDEWLESEIAVVEREHHDAISALSKTADALPGFGIVAAVLGIVITMGHIDGPAEEIGHKVGAALVGTFLGILMSYGFFAPMAGRMEFQGASESNYFRAVKTAVLGMSRGNSPRDVVTQTCRMIGTDCKPNKEELELIFKEGEVA